MGRRAPPPWLEYSSCVSARSLPLSTYGTYLFVYPVDSYFHLGSLFLLNPDSFWVLTFPQTFVVRKVDRSIPCVTASVGVLRGVRAHGAAVASRVQIGKRLVGARFQRRES